MNICITGALGHIGSALIRNLSVKDLDKVYLVDNLLTQRYSSLFDLPPGIKYIFKELDILSPDIEPIIKDSDIVIHLAAITNAEASAENQKDVEIVNKKGTDHIMNLCLKYKTKLLFPSSTSVYGKQTEVVDETCSEEDLQPQSPYAESKIYTEKKLASLARKNLRYTIFRFGTIFGYSIGMRFHTAVNKFTWQAVNGQEITVWRTAMNQKRPYCALSDAINAINTVIRKDVFDQEIYNIVTLNARVKDILDNIQEYVPDIKVKYVDSRIMNQLSYNVSNKKSLKRGFTYAGDLSSDVKQTIEKLKNINLTIKKQL